MGCTNVWWLLFAGIIGGCASAPAHEANISNRLAEAERRIGVLEDEVARLSASGEPVELPDEKNDPMAIATWVTKTGPYDFTIAREALALARGKLAEQARVVPYYREQTYIGYKLVGVVTGAFYRAIGIRSGDVITAVAGTAIDTPSKVGLFEEVFFEGRLTTVTVELLRRDQPKTMTYTVER